MLKNVRRRLSKGRSAFLTVAPSWPSLLRFKYLTAILTSFYATKAIIKGLRSDSIPEEIGSFFSYTLIHRIVSYPRMEFNWWLRMVSVRKRWQAVGLSANQRQWIIPEDQDIHDGRIMKELNVMYHDANKAGKHLDVHLGHLSIIIRVKGKPVEKLIKFNNQGNLTEVSKEHLLDHLRKEIANNSRMVWNHDHTIANARCSWAFDESLRDIKGYGSGATRQVVLRDKVEFYHPRVESSLHFYAPKIFGSQGQYIYQIYPGTSKTAPILIWGKLIPRDEAFKDRLHLKLVQPEELNKLRNMIDIKSNTRKYDGASCYFTGDGEDTHGFKFFSPRYSKETGHRIEYTYKIAEMADKGIKEAPQGMGELMFWKRTLIGKVLAIANIKGPERIAWNYIPATSIGGILNSNEIRPRNIHPEIRVYRIDRWNGQKTYDLEFWKNRQIQKLMIKDLPDNWKVVTLAIIKRNPNWEGFVGVPKGMSINDGLKLKFWADAQDWELIRNEFSISEKGNVQGALVFRSLESGREFDLGPGQVGTYNDCMSILNAANQSIGMVAKVHGRRGHEGRAVKITEWHLDKGIL